MRLDALCHARYGSPSNVCWRHRRKLGHFVFLNSCSRSVTEFLGYEHVIIEELTLDGRPVSLDEQNLYMFRGLHPKFRLLVSSLSTRGSPVMLQELSDFLTTQEFICAQDFVAVGGAGDPSSTIAAFVAQRDGQQHGRW